MSTVYFDTNIYNHLNDKQVNILKELSDAGKIEILTMPEILGELAATFKLDTEQGKKLIRIYEILISHRTLKPPPELIRGEVESLNDKKRRSIFINSHKKRLFKQYINELREGRVGEETDNFLKYSKRKKKENYEACKESKKELDCLWAKEDAALFSDYEAFYNHAFSTGNIRREIHTYLERILDPQQKFIISKIAKIIEKHLHRLPHLRTATRINPALSYRYHLMKEKAKFGDIEDITNLISVTTSDYYVSDDKGAREMASLVFPDKEVLSLEDFLGTF